MITSNSIKGFRFGGYEDVLVRADGTCVYAMAEPFGWAHLMSCVNYRSNGDGTFSVCGAWYGMTAEELLSMPLASIATASAVIGAEYMRAWACDPCETDEEGEIYTDFLLDVATCHLIEHGMDDGSLVRADDSAWCEALRKSGIDATC